MDRLSMLEIGESGGEEDGYVLTRRYHSRKNFPIASHDCEPPCTPRRKLANALALDSEFNVLEKRMKAISLRDNEEKKDNEEKMEVYDEEEKKACDDKVARQSLRAKKGDLVHRGGIKVGNVYCLVSCYFQHPDVLRFSVHVSEKCLLYEVLCAHPTVENESPANVKHIAKLMMHNLVWDSSGELGFSRIR